MIVYAVLQLNRNYFIVIIILLLVMIVKMYFVFLPLLNEVQKMVLKAIYCDALMQHFISFHSSVNLCQLFQFIFNWCIAAVFWCVCVIRTKWSFIYEICINNYIVGRRTASRSVINIIIIYCFMCVMMVMTDTLSACLIILWALISHIWRIVIMIFCRIFWW